MTDPAGTTPEPPQEPLGAIVHRMTEQVPELVRSELRLAQAELTEKGKAAGIGAGLFSAAGLLGLFAFATLIAAGVLGLDVVLPAWAAALIVAAVLLVAAGIAAMVGKKELAEATPPAPERAVAGVKEDVATLKGSHS